jgi:HSP20 family protein
MANQKDSGNQQLMARGAGSELVGWGPLQLMRELLRMDPFGMSPLRSMEQQMWMPSFEVRETDDAYMFKADLPGVKAEDVEITLVGSRLQISGKRENEMRSDEGTVHAYERVFGTFTRSFVLPETADTDKIRTELKHGVLSVVVPKRAGTNQQRKTIPVNSKA